MGEAEAAGNRRWLVLFIGLIALTAGCTFQYGIAYLIPALRHEGFSLELAGILVACPTAGLLLIFLTYPLGLGLWLSLTDTVEPITFTAPAGSGLPSLPSPQSIVAV